jgi:hypothetical protein
VIELADYAFNSMPLLISNDVKVILNFIAALPVMHKG